MSKSTLRGGLLRAFAAAATLLTLASAATACAGSEATTTADGRTVLRYEGAAGQVLFPELAEALGYYEDIDLEWIGDNGNGPQSLQNTATKQIEFGSAFNGAVIKAQAGNSPLTSVLASYGSDTESFSGYYVLEGSPIRTARDLIGKKVGMNTLGAHHEFLVREWLSRQGLSPEEISQVELIVVPPVSTEQALREGRIDVGTLGSVFRETALERGGIRPLFTDESLFGSFSYGTYAFRTDFIERNRDAVEDFVQGTARAIRWAQVVPREEVIAKFEEIIEGRGRNETTDLVGYWRSPGVAGPGGVITDQEISTWIDWLVRNGELEEGAIEVSEVYTNEFNPYSNGTYEPTSGPDGGPIEEAK
ncbi:ABC transporter substrate-binding protein [Rhodococcus sp. Z13]|uniref:ABC transporter substrate-binding protein n=1 Tax=Rhodococcus sacchari TaxID=2962047 RepID=A0ACD4DI17_9NOCA|nr:ABC transporter substrate-binding protein [Rhodococcus sp. Z13]UYP19676.1 ABC transporter substrate-binding protein [Rhodococcus sp. Z13]